MNTFKQLVSAFLLLPALVSAQSVSEYWLDNGLHLIVKQDHRAPVVVSQVWYKVGSSYEHNGITGISHILEHMMFKGTENLAPNEFSKIIAANGGRENAFTGRDYTAYFQILQKDRLAVSFRLEAERMRKLIIDEEELIKEREVVAEERRLRTEDNPQGRLWEAFNAAAFVSSPYHHPVIGWMSDIRHYTAENIRQWYQKWYAPDNATVVVAGDVDPAAVYQLAQQYFGPLAPAGKTFEVKPQIEVNQHGKRTVQVNMPAKLPYLIMGWKVPVVNTAETLSEGYALEVLAGVLASGSSARFAREMVRGQEVAASVNASYNLFSRLDDLFSVVGTPAQGKTIPELKQAIIAQIHALKNQLVTAEELERIKVQVVANAVYERDSLFYQAMQIGMLATVGLDHRLADTHVDNVRAVTAEEVQAVAKKYLIDTGLTVAELKPLLIKKQLGQGSQHDH